MKFLCKFNWQLYVHILKSPCPARGSIVAKSLLPFFQKFQYLHPFFCDLNAPVDNKGPLGVWRFDLWARFSWCKSMGINEHMATAQFNYRATDYLRL